MKNPMMFTPTVLIILCSLLPLSVRSQQVVFEENFNSLKLGASQEEGVKKNVGHCLWSKKIISKSDISLAY